MNDFGSNGPTTRTADEVRKEHAQRRTRFFIGFAVVEALVLIPAVLLIFVLEVIDPSIGIWVILGLAAVGATVMSIFVLSATQRQNRYLEALEGR